MRIHLDRASPLSLGDQIESQVRLLIDAQRLRPGDPLPTVRDLAASVDVNPNTVAAAYGRLEQQGYLVQRKRAGTRVAALPPHDPKRAFAAALASEAARQASNLGISAAGLVEAVAAQAAQTSVAPRFRVALLAADALQAEESRARAAALFGRDVELVPVTPAAYTSSDYHLTVVHPTLTRDLRNTRSNTTALDGPAMPSRQLDFGPDFPAPAD